MFLKNGVIFANPHPAILCAMDVIDMYWRGRFGTGPVITSASDGYEDTGPLHSANSLHYGVVGDVRNRAIDIRTRDLNGAQKAQAKTDLRKLLGEMYDVILEKTHLHVEFDIKKVERYTK